jgi:hypothetical protein
VSRGAISDFERLLSDRHPSAVDCRSLSLLFNQLWNSSLERALLLDESRGCVPFRSDWLSLLSVDTFETILWESKVSIGSERSLFEVIIGLGASYFPLLCHMRWNELNANLLTVLRRTDFPVPSESVWSALSPLLPLLDPLLPACFASLIVSKFPALFAGFRGKRFTLLWRGSRDGFGVNDFHRRCNGHANTLTLIEDTKGNIFGGFTPVEWDSGSGYKADPSLKSFLFTLKNPHNVPARKFALRPREKDKAILSESKRGPCFRDFGVSYAFALSPAYACAFGSAYANDTGLDETTFFTGSKYFTVKEIEVFEIAD